ncbi:LysR family transcriptional regulator [Sphingomonas sp. YR710]|jgi:DNA-binding transcriptional LysR family regulator|uniref:LysR family transcriptional regulator n=1 Tax=Sphingomonas sp. YR710 TaxID=1882773 RepID=UPI000B821381|nr:LysR family transcriptional regulator [Sphingomonas sp. YR710]
MLTELTVFVRVVELRNISAAARSLRLSPAAASHRIQQLETRIGARLLNRTTRNLQPTEEGYIFYEHALDVLSAVERAESSIASVGGTPSGALRITAPLGFGRRVLAPLVAEYNELYPRVQIRLRLSDHLIDLLAEAIDVAVRMANPTDSSFIARRLADCPRVLCAAPSYLARHGTPVAPAELSAHNCLLLRFPGSQQARWTLHDDGRPVALNVTGNLDADDGDVLTEWALSGHGIALKPWWEVADHLRSGALIEVLPNNRPESVSLVALFPHRQLVSAKVRTFVEFLKQKPQLIEAPDIPEPARIGAVI